MLIESLVLAILIGFFAGGNVKALIALKIKGIGVLLLAVILQVIAFQATQYNLTMIQPVLPIFHTLSYFLLIGFALFNRTLPGAYLFALGVGLNALVIGLNGGLMPVDPSILPEANRQILLKGTGTHGLLTEKTHVQFLADRFYAEIPGLTKQLFSLGDVLIDLGIGYLVLRTMLKGRKSAEKKDR